MDLIKESIRKNWGNVKNEQLDEGLSDHLNSIGERLGIVNADRDLYRKLNKDKNLGSKPYGSKAISAINVLGKILRGRKWQNLEGGYFTRDKRSYQDEMYQLEDQMSQAVNDIVTKLFIARQLALVCEPTKIALYKISSQVPSMPPVGEYYQLVSDVPMSGSGGGLHYGGNLVNGLIQTDINDVFNWKDSKEVADIVYKHIFGSHKKVSKDFEWMRKSLLDKINYAKIHRNSVNSIIGGLSRQLDAIDTEINRMAWGRGYAKNPQQLQSDPRIRHLAERKAHIFNGALVNLETMARNSQFGNFTLDNGDEPMEWFFNPDALANEIAQLPKKTANDFLRVL